MLRNETTNLSLNLRETKRTLLSSEDILKPSYCLLDNPTGSNEHVITRLRFFVSFPTTILSAIGSSLYDAASRHLFIFHFIEVASILHSVA